MKKLKFRIWDEERKQMEFRTMETICQFGWPLQATKNFTIMCSTGLSDRLGKEIYEGDIVRTYGKIGEVKFGRFMSSHEGGCSRYHFHQGFFVNGDDEGQMWDKCSEDINWDQVEVIGNIKGGEMRGEEWKKNLK